MYLTKAQVNLRLNNSLKVEPKSRNPIQGVRQTREEKVLIGVLSKFDSQENIAREFKTTQQNVSLVSRGMTSVTHFDPSLREEIDAAVPKTTKSVSDKALDVLMSAIGVVEDTIGGTKKATEASMVARNMASVYKEMSPSSSNAGGSRIQININAPNQKSERDYESLEVVNL